MKQWYETLFDNYGKKYDQEAYTKGTTGECDFIEQEIGPQEKLKILDIGCGTGRHSIELSKRGYHVTGIDLSESQLKRAREKANENSLDIVFLQEDARQLNFKNIFDVVIMICEGAFPLMETDQMNYKILGNAAKALKRGGKFIFTTLNALFPIFNSVDEFYKKTYQEGNAFMINHRFDLMTFREYDTIIIEDDDGNRKKLNCNERYYAPCEIKWLLETLHFQNIEIFAAQLGNFSRNDPLTINDHEMLVIAHKTS